MSSEPVPTPIEGERARILAEYRRREADGRQTLYGWNRQDALFGHHRLLSVAAAGLAREGLQDLAHLEVLDVGTGGARWLRDLQEWGADPARLHGVDLVESRVEAARRKSPHLDVRVASGWALPFAAASMDLVSAHTVLSSVTDPEARLVLAKEMARVTRPGGLVMIFDFWIADPRNPHTVGLRRRELARLFPDWERTTDRLYLAPPIARRLARVHPLLIGATELACPFLRTHAIHWLRKP